ncbi:MAG: 50S ribosomal protein L18 [Candidatus Colwellbacteria bacterium]|nr:50S ribosomal protein L18 [Candidatus Colwellbacteria bacterium]
MNKETRTKRTRRVKRVVARVKGTARRPRLVVFRSNKDFYIQLIDDEKGNTLVSASTRELKTEKATKTEKAAHAGRLLAEKAIEAGIKEAVFDRRFYKYHGRVKAAADGAREAGLKM